MESLWTLTRKSGETIVGGLRYHYTKEIPFIIRLVSRTGEDVWTSRVIPEDAEISDAYPALESSGRIFTPFSWGLKGFDRNGELLWEASPAGSEEGVQLLDGTIWFLAEPGLVGRDPETGKRTVRYEIERPYASLNGGAAWPTGFLFGVTDTEAVRINLATGERIVFHGIAQGTGSVKRYNWHHPVALGPARILQTLKRPSRSEILAAVNVEDGEVEWSKPGVRAEPAVGPRDTVYLQGARLRALDLETGREKWRTRGWDGEETRERGPVVDRCGTVYFVRTVDGKGELCAFRADGTKLWCDSAGPDREYSRVFAMGYPDRLIVGISSVDQPDGRLADGGWIAAVGEP